MNYYIYMYNGIINKNKHDYNECKVASVTSAYVYHT